MSDWIQPSTIRAVRENLGLTQEDVVRASKVISRVGKVWQSISKDRLEKLETIGGATLEEAEVLSVVFNIPLGVLCLGPKEAIKYSKNQFDQAIFGELQDRVLEIIVFSSEFS